MTPLIILFLQYGADPLCETLRDLLQITRDGRSVFGEQGLLDIRAVLRKKLERATSRSNATEPQVAKRRRSIGTTDAGSRYGEQRTVRNGWLEESNKAKLCDGARSYTAMAGVGFLCGLLIGWVLIH
jgi:hypothetical protein